MKKTVLILSLFALLLQGCGELKKDLNIGLKVFSSVSKEYDCLENKFNVSTSNGVKTVDVTITCKDETGMYTGRILLEVHRQLKKEGMKVDFYNLILKEENTQTKIAAKDIDLGLELEEKALLLKSKFEKQETDFLLQNSEDDLVKDIERQNLFEKTKDFIQSSYPHYTGFKWTESFYQFGFEQDDVHFLILMISPKTKKLIGIRYN